MTDEISIINKALSEYSNECKTSILISNNTYHYKCTVCPACLNTGNEYYCTRHSFELLGTIIDPNTDFTKMWSLTMKLKTRLLQ